MNRKFPPLAANHPLVGKACKRCQQPFAAGDVTTLVDPRPANAEDAARAAAGQAYTAKVDPAHWACLIEALLEDAIAVYTRDHGYRWQGFTNTILLVRPDGHVAMSVRRADQPDDGRFDRVLGLLRKHGWPVEGTT